MSRPSKLVSLCDRTVFLGKLARLLVGDLALLCQVRLVTDEEDDSVGVGEVSRIGQPAAEVIVGASSKKEDVSVSLLTNGTQYRVIS